MAATKAIDRFAEMADRVDRLEDELDSMSMDLGVERARSARMRPVIAAAVKVRHGTRGGGYAVRFQLEHDDRCLFDEFNQVVDAYLYPTRSPTRP